MRKTLEPLLPALLAIGGAAGLMAKPATAVELGELRIESTLGQPLSASIPFAVNQHEEMYGYCISLSRGADIGVQYLTRAKVTVAGNRIVLTGNKPVNEPLLALRLTVNCPYTVRLARDYMLMINPAGTAVAEATYETQLPAREPEVTTAAAPVVAGQSSPGVMNDPTPVVASQSTPPVTPVVVDEPAADTVASGEAPVDTSSYEPVAAEIADPPRVFSASTSDEAPIYVGDAYLVISGDTLSKIAKRIEGLTIGVWPAVDAIFLANPDAFVSYDKNWLMAGSVLTIPPMDDSGVVADVTDQAAPISADTPYVAETTTSYDAYESDNDRWAENEVAEDYSYVGEPAPSSVDEPTYQDDTAILGSGDFDPVANATEVDEFVNADEPAAVAEVDEAGEFAGAQTGEVFATTENVVEDTADSALPEPAVVADAPATVDVAATAIPVAKTLDKSDGIFSSWLVWAGGGALALILGLLAFRRKLGELFGGASAERIEPALDGDDEITQRSRTLTDVDFTLDDVVPDAEPMVMETDLDTSSDAETVENPEIAFAETTELDLAIAASSGSDNSTALDADLGAGTGLQDGTDLDVAQDFGFSATDENAIPIDLEIPLEIDVDTEASPTDIIPPNVKEEESILDAEVPPVDNDDDSQYDLSVIVDATKQALGESDATARDLEAVQLDAGQRNPDDSAFTLSKEVDFKILEQDYEEELTQTQAVNEEITRAAAELAQRMDVEDEVLDVTVDMPVRQDSPAQNDDVGDDADATELNEELTLNDELTLNEDATVEMDANADTVDTKNLG